MQYILFCVAMMPYAAPRNSRHIHSSLYWHT
nr:MAG TPA: hypothetical protein [Caudoviricetes sp.]